VFESRRARHNFPKEFEYSAPSQSRSTRRVVSNVVTSVKQLVRQQARKIYTNAFILACRIRWWQLCANVESPRCAQLRHHFQPSPAECVLMLRELVTTFGRNKWLRCLECQLGHFAHGLPRIIWKNRPPVASFGCIGVCCCILSASRLRLTW
jgi:hypothetical protein